MISILVNVALHKKIEETLTHSLILRALNSIMYRYFSISVTNHFTVEIMPKIQMQTFHYFF